MSEENLYAKEYWTGDSRDGSLVNGDGYHYYRMRDGGVILEAYEFYEDDSGEVVVTPMPEMKNVGWIEDLGFEDLEDLETIEEREYRRIKKLTNQAQI